MPELDVSDILSDPDIADVFVVKRRADVIDVATGRSTVQVTEYPNVIGVVLHVDPSDNERKEEAQMTSLTIAVVTRFRLRAAAEAWQPDIVRLGGIDYTVKKVLRHTRYGAGFVKAECVSMNASDPPPA